MSLPTKPATPALPALATADQVAEVMHTTPARLAQDRYRGVGVPYVKFGRKVLYRWSDVQAYIAANTVTPGGAA